MGLDLQNLLSSRALSRKDKALLLLAHDRETEKSVSQLKKLAAENGLREASKWNFSQILADLKECAARLPNGWIITTAGLSHLDSVGVISQSPSKAVQSDLRLYSSTIASASTRAFLEESIGALEYGFYRSAVVLSWVGAVATLYEKVLSDYLYQFNSEAFRRNPKWKEASTTDDLSRMKEFDFLQVIAAISLIGKNTKDELEQCLKLRNTCGHPNSHSLGEHRVTSHVETLILNVFAKYTAIGE